MEHNLFLYWSFIGYEFDHFYWSIKCHSDISRNLFECTVNILLYKYPLWGRLSWSYGSWIYNYLYNQCLSPLMLWVRTLHRQGTTLCDKVCLWLPSTPVSSTNKIDCHGITEILLKVALNNIKLFTWATEIILEKKVS